MTPIPAAFDLVGRKHGTTNAFSRFGRHARTGQLVKASSPYGKWLRARRLLQLAFHAKEWADLADRALAQGYDIKPVARETTPHVSGKEYRVHARLLVAIEDAAKHAGIVANIVSGFRSYAKQLSLWLLFLSGKGAPANKPGTSKHEAIDGYDVARAADVYIEGVAFWTWMRQHGQSDFALQKGLYQPHANEPWHVELRGL